MEIGKLAWKESAWFYDVLHYIPSLPNKHLRCTDVNLEDLNQFISLSYKPIQEPLLNPLQHRCVLVEMVRFYHPVLGQRDFSHCWQNVWRPLATISFTLQWQEQKHNVSFRKLSSCDFDSWPPFSNTIFPREIITNWSIRFWDKPASCSRTCLNMKLPEILPWAAKSKELQDQWLSIHYDFWNPSNTFDPMFGYASDVHINCVWFHCHIRDIIHLPTGIYI